MKKNKISISIHLFVWGLFILFNYLILRSSGINFDFKIQALSIIIYLTVFYVFYFFLASLIFKKKKLVFLILSILVIVSGVLLNLNIHEQRHEKVIKELIKEKQVDNNADMLLRREIGIRHRKDQLGIGFKFIVSTLQIIFFVLVSLLIRIAQRGYSNEKARYILEKEKSDAELQFLKQQINPHFIFNSLNSIYSLANKKSDLTAEAILKLSALFRYTLYHSEKDKVPLADELATIENYIDLQRLRLTSKVKVSYNINGNPNIYFIAPLLLIPIFENAFKYGVDSVSDSFINVDIVIKEGRLNLEVSNKIVPQKYKLYEESGIGLKNIKRRLEILYPNNYSFKINENNETFTVKMSLTL